MSTENDKYLDKEGFAHFWENMEDILEGKVDVQSINLENKTTTILEEVKKLGVAGIDYARFMTLTDGGSSNIPDKPTGSTNGGFCCIAHCQGKYTTSDYEYQLTCYVHGRANPWIAYVGTGSTSIVWNLQPLTTDSALSSISTNPVQNKVVNTALSGKNKTIYTSYNIAPTADTTTAWKTALGNDGIYWTWYNTASKFANQPAQYGFLKTVIGSSDIRQDFYVQTSGVHWYRTGNGTGWYGVSGNAGNFKSLGNEAPGNGTLTIQKNGSNVQTFTANQTSNVTANITTDYNKTANNLTPTADTTADWKTVLGSTDGAYLTIYDTAGKFTNQPEQYGSLETILTGNSIFQVWHSLPYGSVLYRSGNASGWSLDTSGSWVSGVNSRYYYNSTDKIVYKKATIVGKSGSNTIPAGALLYTRQQVFAIEGMVASGHNGKVVEIGTSLNNTAVTTSTRHVQIKVKGVGNSSSTEVYCKISPYSFVDVQTDGQIIFADITEEDYTSASGNASYIGLTKPNDATLTIQKNGTNVQTFTADASSNKTANITTDILVNAGDNRASLIPTDCPNKAATLYFTTEGGLDSQANDNKYCDALFLNTWSNTEGSGGKVNLIAASKTGDQALYHYRSDYNDTTWDSKKRIAYTDDITDAYWANVKVSTSSATNTTPSFARSSYTGTNYPHLAGNGNILTVSADGGWATGNTGNYLFGKGTFRPSSNSSGLTDLGAAASSGIWRNLYLSGGIYHGTYFLTLPNKAGTIAMIDDIPTTMTGATSSSAGTSGLVPAPSSGDNIKYLSGSGTWTTPPTTYSSYLGNSPGTAGYWKKLGNLTFPQHQQGKSVLLKIMLGFGNNGTNAQQAFIDLIGQLGWTGSYSGRAGWTASYNKMNTGKSVNNFDIKVIANSVLDYDVYIRAAGTYMSVTPVFIPGINNDGTENAIWTPDYSNWTQDAPSGTECDIAKIGVAIGDIPTKVSDLTNDVGGNVFVGTCATAAATAAKEVTISADQNFALQAGVMIVVKSTYTNSANNPTIEVNNTGAKSIWYNTGLITTGNLNKAGYASRFSYYVYDGTNWVWVNWSLDADTTYSSMSVAEGQAGTATSQRVMRADYLKQIIQSYVPTTYAGSLITDGSITFDKTASGEFLKLETSATDPGEGSALDDNTLLAVYDVPDDYRRGEVLACAQNVDTLATTSEIATVWSAGTWSQFGRMAVSSNKHILTIANPTSNAWVVEVSLDCPSVLPGSVISGSSVITTTPATGIAELDSNNAISKVITWSRIASRGSVFNRKYVTIPANTTKKFCACICTYQTSASPTGTWEGGDEISGTTVGAGFGGPSCTLTATLIDDGE